MLPIPPFRGTISTTIEPVNHPNQKGALAGNDFSAIYREPHSSIYNDGARVTASEICACFKKHRLQFKAVKLGFGSWPCDLDVFVIRDRRGAVGGWVLNPTNRGILTPPQNGWFIRENKGKIY